MMSCPASVVHRHTQPQHGLLRASLVQHHLLTWQLRLSKSEVAFDNVSLADWYELIRMVPMSSAMHYFPSIAQLIAIQRSSQ
jgi:hypothetical protein